VSKSAIKRFDSVWDAIEKTPAQAENLTLRDNVRRRLGSSRLPRRKIAAFEAAYSPEGAWAQLFAPRLSYLGTELLRDAYIPGGYLTIDRWASEEDFRAFRKDHDQEYETLDRSAIRSPAARPASAPTPSERPPRSPPSRPQLRPGNQPELGSSSVKSACAPQKKPRVYGRYTLFLRFFAIFFYQCLSILLQSHRNPIQAAAPFPREKIREPRRRAIFRRPSQWPSPKTAPKP
jgi:hypothetical protein